MKTTVLKTTCYVLRRAHLIGQETRESKRGMTRTKRILLHMIAIGIVAGFATLPLSAQTGDPWTTSSSTRIAGLEPRWNPDHTEIIDRVYLSGTIHTVTEIWMSSETLVDRLKITANLERVNGTSETTGQRYRLVGSSVVDLAHPNVTFRPDGSFTSPILKFTFNFMKVDPEPARLDGNLTTVWSYATYTPAPSSDPFRDCVRIIAPNGTPTNYSRCGTVIVAWYLNHPPVIEAGSFSVRARPLSSSHCPTGPLCEVTNGARIFTYDPGLYYDPRPGDYLTPLYLRLSASDPDDDPITIQWYCKTGSSLAPVTYLGDGIYSCEPIYSEFDPTYVYAVAGDGRSTVTSEVRNYVTVQIIN